MTLKGVTFLIQDDKIIIIGPIKELLSRWVGFSAAPQSVFRIEITSNEEILVLEA